MKKILALLCVAALLCAMFAGCGSKTADTTPATSEPAATETPAAEPAVAEDTAAADQAAADAVAALIDAIYVQTRTEETDAQCAAAKAAWDALTDAQKELVEGEEADPDYFGRDTGDASLDNPGNADGIGEKELLVVSFGTSFNDSRVADIYGVEQALQAAYPDWSVRRAFTAQIIINHVQAREGEFIDNMDQALERAVANGVKTLVVQPTHLMHGAEYDELCEALANYADKFETVVVAEPLLGPVGTDGTVINSDKLAVAEAVVAAAAADAGFESAQAAADAGVAFVLMGHGTSHNAKVSYTQMQTAMTELGYTNVFIGTVEGEPEATECGNVIEAVAAANFTKVVLRPLMVVAGDHANNDMAGDEEDSWKSMFLASGKFESVDCQISGLGSIEAVQALYVAHAGEAIAQTAPVAPVTVSCMIATAGEISYTTTALTVADLDADGAVTINDVMMAAHEDGFEGGAAAGYGSAVGEWGLGMTKLWGVENGGSYGYYVDNASAWSLADPVADGALVVAYSYADTTYYSDMYTFFSTSACEIAAGEAAALTLNGYSYDASWNLVSAPLAGAKVTVNGEDCGVVTDENGAASVTFAEAGSYIVSTVVDGMITVPSICFVTVK